MYQPRTGYYPSVKAEVRAKFKEFGASTIYQQCQAARRSILIATGVDLNNPSRSAIVNSWNKLPTECYGYEETEEFFNWRELAQFPTSWTFIPIDPKINRSKHETCDWKRKNLSISYDCNSRTSLSRQEYMDKYMPKECKCALPTDQVDFV